MSTPIKNITIKKETDIEGDNNRGWIVHKLSAYIGDLEVGYIKIAYIPFKRFLKHYARGVADYAHLIGGCPSPKGEMLGSDINKKDIAKVDKEWIANMYWYNHNESWIDACKIHKLIPSMNDKEAQEFFESKVVPVINERYGAQFRGFCEYWVDYPIVDFINVDTSFRRKGLGTRLYVEAAKWIKEDFNLTLHSSTLQQEPAKLVWHKMLKHGIAVLAPPRKCDKYKSEQRARCMIP